VILQESHLSGYEAQMLLVGVRLIFVKTRAELERAAGERTAMLFFLNKAEPLGTIGREEWIRFGKERGIPSFNDAAADVPPMSRLGAYVQEGFDLVAFSGGKGLLGPQCTGLLLGRKDLIDAGRHAISPAHGIGRGMKVGKEDMIGLLAAVERYLHADHDAERKELERRVSQMIETLAPIPGLNVRRDLPPIANHVPHVVIDWGAEPKRPAAGRVVALLMEGDPPIAIAQEGERGLRVSVWMMQGDEHQVVARRLEEVLKVR
jgi:L-seryl-tRNA(Ser) seleniumtransferase